MTYATQADVEKLIQVVFANDPDPVIEVCLDWADAVVDQYVAGPFDGSTATLKLDGGDLTGAVLALFPDIPADATIAEVRENGTVLTADEWTLTSGTLYRLSGDYTRTHWTAGFQNVEVDVTYAATVPDVVVLVAARVAARIFREGADHAAQNNAGAGGLKSEAIDTYRREWAINPDETPFSVELTADDRELLAGFARVRGGFV